MIIENGILKSVKPGDINNGVFEFPPSVTSIGHRAFEDCTSLTSLNIPKSVTSIGLFAFLGCTRLTSITIPDSVTSIGEAAFRDCTSLTSITIPDSVTSISHATFMNCANLRSITIPGSVASIGTNAFAICTSLTSITLPNSVTSIGMAAFIRCTRLTSITIPDSVTSIGEAAFMDCANLRSITIPGSVASIGTNAFAICTSLTSITLPNSVTSIGMAAFLRCTSLTSLTIPDSVTSIGRDAFKDCYSLRSIYVVAETPEAFNLIKNQLPENLRGAAMDIVNDITTKLKELEELARIPLNSDISTKPTSSLEEEEEASVNRANELIEALSSELLIISGAIHQNLEQRFHSAIVLLQLKKNCLHEALDFFVNHPTVSAEAAFQLASASFNLLHQQQENTAKMNQLFLYLFKEFDEDKDIQKLLERSALEKLSLLDGEENNIIKKLNEYGIDRCLPSSAILKILNEAKGLDNDLLNALNEAKDKLPLLTATQVLNLINSSPFKEVFEEKYPNTKIVTYDSIIAMSNIEEIKELREYQLPGNTTLNPDTLRKMLDPKKDRSRTYKPTDDEIMAYCDAPIKESEVSSSSQGLFSASTNKKNDNSEHKPSHGPSSSSSS